MRVGVPKERKVREYRVGMTPAGVRELVERGHSVTVESGAGVGSGHPDADYAAAGAIVAADAGQSWRDSDLVVKVKEPVPEKYPLLAAHQVLFTYLHLAADPACTRALLAAGTTAIAYETVSASSVPESSSR